MSNVARLDDRMKHINIQVENGDVHVIPISVFRHVASGGLTVNKIADFIQIYQQITKEWLRLKGL